MAITHERGSLFEKILVHFLWDSRACISDDSNNLANFVAAESISGQIIMCVFLLKYQ